MKGSQFAGPTEVPAYTRCHARLPAGCSGLGACHHSRGSPAPSSRPRSHPPCKARWGLQRDRLSAPVVSSPCGRSRKKGGVHRSPPGSPLLLYDVLQPGHHQLRGEGPKTESGAAGLQRGDYLGEVVADEAEAGVFGELLDHCKGGEELDGAPAASYNGEGSKGAAKPSLGAPHLASGRSGRPESWHRLRPG